MPRRVEDFRGLTQASRVKLLYAVQRIPGRRLRELADEAGIHINTAREHLHVLEEEGFIVSRPLPTGRRGRPPVVFDPVQRADANPRADRRVARAKAHGDLLRRFDPSFERSGQHGPEARDQVDALYSHLDDVGLEPTVNSDGLGIDVAPCAFHELIDELGTVMCAVHANLIRDQLDQVAGPLALGALAPFVTPHRCHIALKRKSKPSME